MESTIFCPPLEKEECFLLKENILKITAITKKSSLWSALWTKFLTGAAYTFPKLIRQQWSCMWRSGVCNIWNANRLLASLRLLQKFWMKTLIKAWGTHGNTNSLPVKRHTRELWINYHEKMKKKVCFSKVEYALTSVFWCRRDIFWEFDKIYSNVFDFNSFLDLLGDLWWLDV